MEEKEFKYGIEVELLEDFLVISETLERLGVGNHRRKVMSPSCYILKKRDKYYIMHFKELLKLDGNTTTIKKDDLDRRDKIVNFLERWGLVKPVNDYNRNPESSVLIIPHKEKKDYEIRHKYTIGRE